MRNKQHITVLKVETPESGVSTGGLKARQSLAQGNALCHSDRCSLSPERATSLWITPFQGLVDVMHSVRRVLPCAIDYRAFSPVLNIQCLISYKFFVPYLPPTSAAKIHSVFLSAAFFEEIIITDNNKQ
jgi:hypothetical protein